MTFSVELSVSPTRTIAKVFLNAIEETFVKKKIFIRLAGVQVI